MNKITFNKPYLTGKEVHYIYEAVYKNNHISGNGEFTKKCQKYFIENYDFNKTLLTTSCTDALEMSALLLKIKPGDEVIMPSYTFVSTALAFVRQGAKIVFVDSRSDHPGIDENKIEEQITKKTKVIVLVHYAGVACDMDKIMKIVNKHNLFIVEDAAQAVDSYYKGEPLGGIGDFGCFSFHETKNIQCGEGGMIVIRDEKHERRSEIIWEKGTNRAEFFRGEVDKYNWVDIGSSFLPSELNAAFLFAQIENLNQIQNKRIKIWNKYYERLKDLENKGFFKLPIIPDYATNNAHMFYIICNSGDDRNKLIKYLKKHNIRAVFHYLSLHKSPYYRNKHDERELLNADRYSECLIRLPIWVEMSDNEIDAVVSAINKYYR